VLRRGGGMSRGNPDLDNSPSTSPISPRLTNEQLKFGGLQQGGPIPHDDFLGNQEKSHEQLAELAQQDRWCEIWWLARQRSQQKVSNKAGRFCLPALCDGVNFVPTDRISMKKYSASKEIETMVRTLVRQGWAFHRQGKRGKLRSPGERGCWSCRVRQATIALL
jgi:hypothetical protein